MDETVPLLPDEVLEIPIKSTSTDPNIVDFGSEGNTENPRDWAKNYKWGIVALLAFMSFAVYVFTLFSTMIPTDHHPLEPSLAYLSYQSQDK